MGPYVEQKNMLRKARIKIFLKRYMLLYCPDITVIAS